MSGAPIQIGQAGGDCGFVGVDHGLADPLVAGHSPQQGDALGRGESDVEGGDRFGDRSVGSLLGDEGSEVLRGELDVAVDPPREAFGAELGEAAVEGVAGAGGGGDKG